MKRLLILLFMFASLAGVNAQQCKGLSYSAAIGYGWDISTPSYNPFGVQISALYDFNPHFGVGCEIGITKYEKLVIPVCVVGEYRSRQIGKTIPFIDASFGYGFTPNRKANGGIQLTPSLGILYRLSAKLNLSASLFYQVQKLERVKNYDNDWFHAEFQEHLTHNTIGLRLGILFKQ